MIMKRIPVVILPVKYGKRKTTTPAYIRIVRTIRVMLFVTLNLPLALKLAAAPRGLPVYSVCPGVMSWTGDQASQYRTCYSNELVTGHSFLYLTGEAATLCTLSGLAVEGLRAESIFFVPEISG
jgi:hypothetical protein